MRFGQLRIETSAGRHAFCVQVYLGDLAPEAVRVELYADPADGAAPSRSQMARGAALDGAAKGYEYRAEVPAARPASDYTPRIIPYHAAARIPLEAARILWYR